MKRDLLGQLDIWKTNPLRKPLILRGARQVGKSWLVKEFGKTFAHYVEINFDKKKSATHIFEGDLDPAGLLNKISFHTGEKLIPGETLLFLDEIQECENAIKALRYFKEELPELHVIAAGSLLDFTLDKIGVPVGRIQFLHLYPLSFAEFLTVNGFSVLRDYLLSDDLEKTLLDAGSHAKLIEQLHLYMWLGGMPAVVDTWLQYQDPKRCQELQDEIILTYEADFHKYAKDRQIPHVSKIFTAVPKQLGRKFKFAHVDHEIRSFYLKEALILLKNAGIVHFCYHTSGQRPPLAADINEKKFKIFFLDIGLAQRMLGLELSQWVTHFADIKSSGPITEQFVAQEFIAYTNPKNRAALYYWHREAKSSNAEVDFLMTRRNQVIPVEVKSSATGHMKSMQSFLKSHPQSPYGLKISAGNFAHQTHLQEIPLYSIEFWMKRFSSWLGNQ